MKTTKSGWVLLFAHGLLVALAGMYWLARGQLFERDLYEQIVGPTWPAIVAFAPAVERVIGTLVRLLGASAFSLGIVVMAIAATSFRRGERWAWYAAWALPMQAAVDLATRLGYGAASGPGIALDVTLLALSLLALTTSASALESPPEVADDHAAA